MIYLQHIRRHYHPKYTFITLAPISYLCSLAVRAVHRHRTDVGSIPAGGPIVDEFLSTVTGQNFDLCIISTLHIASERNCELHSVSYHNCNYFVFIDVNECSLDTNSCDSNADCNNAVGSYSCECRSGYAGNGKSCLGIY